MGVVSSKQPGMPGVLAVDKCMMSSINIFIIIVGINIRIIIAMFIPAGIKAHVPNSGMAAITKNAAIIPAKIISIVIIKSMMNKKRDFMAK